MSGAARGGRLLRRRRGRRAGRPLRCVLRRRQPLRRRGVRTGRPTPRPGPGGRGRPDLRAGGLRHHPARHRQDRGAVHHVRRRGGGARHPAGHVRRVRRVRSDPASPPEHARPDDDDLGLPALWRARPGGRHPVRDVRRPRTPDRGSRPTRSTSPAGVDSGSTLRLAGRGAVGPRGGAAGDLYVHVRVRPHERYTRVGHDLVTTVPVSIVQAALGTTITLPTLDGEEELRIPAGSQSGRVFTLRGRGVPTVRGRGRGDLRAELVVAGARPSSRRRRRSCSDDSPTRWARRSSRRAPTACSRASSPPSPDRTGRGAHGGPGGRHPAPRPRRTCSSTRWTTRCSTTTIATTSSASCASAPARPSRSATERAAGVPVDPRRRPRAARPGGGGAGAGPAVDGGVRDRQGRPARAHRQGTDRGRCRSARADGDGAWASSGGRVIGGGRRSSGCGGSCAAPGCRAAGSGCPRSRTWRTSTSS